MEDLTRYAEIACDAARKAGAEFADVSCSKYATIGVDIEKGSIRSSDVRWIQGLGVRAFFRGGLGWASGDRVDEEAAASIGKEAAELAKFAEPDPDFVSLPSPKSCPDIPGLFDERVAALNIKDLIRILLEQVDAAKSIAGDAIVNADIDTSNGQFCLANTMGVSICQPRSFIRANVQAIVRRDDSVGSYYDFDYARMLEDFDPTRIGVRAAEMAIRSLGARKIETGIMPVVLGPYSGMSVFNSLIDSAGAEDVQRKRSFLAGMEGKQVASGVVTVVDDPSIPRGMSSRGCDNEGTPSTKMTIIEDGVLLTYLHNSYTANKAGVEPTGHGTRGGISSSNVIPQLGQNTAQEIIAEVKDGLYINMGGISPNRITGDVSASVDFGFKIEDGEITYPVKNTMIAGNFLQMMKNLDAVSSDYREEPGQIMPTVRIQDVRVAGGK